MSKSKRRNKKNRIWRIERRAGVEAIRKARACMNTVFDRYVETGKPLEPYDAGIAKAKEFGDKFGLTSELYGVVYDSVFGMFRQRSSVRAELERESKAAKAITVSKESASKSSASDDSYSLRDYAYVLGLLATFISTGVAIGIDMNVGKEWSWIPATIAFVGWIAFLVARLYEDLREG